jgi:Na+-driven multidrug efflux pump
VAAWVAQAKISAYSVCAREAARLGAAASAAHNLCFQLGVATTQLCESVAIATQTLLARELAATQPLPTKGGAAAAGSDGSEDGESDGESDRDPAADGGGAGSGVSSSVLAARHILRRCLMVGAFVSSMTSLVTFLNRKAVVAGLTTLPDVRAAAYGVLPLVLLCQVRTLTSGAAHGSLHVCTRPAACAWLPQRRA